MAEVLRPERKSITKEFLRGFDGMTTAPVSIDEPEAAKAELIASFAGGMPEPHRHFLLSFNSSGKPDSALLDVPCAKDLPAVRWRHRNLDLLAQAQRMSLVEKPAAALFHRPPHP